MQEPDRLINGQAALDDVAIDRAIRPKTLAEYVGQPAVREQMEIFIPAARDRGEALDHVLIFGPPGLGKTTLSHIIANEMGVNLRQTSGPVLERPGDLAALLTNLEPHDVLFVELRAVPLVAQHFALYRNRSTYCSTSGFRVVPFSDTPHLSTSE